MSHEIIEDDKSAELPPISETSGKKGSDLIGSFAVGSTAHVTHKSTENFQVQIDEILSSPLTPESFNGYADKALDDVIHIVSEITSQYLDKRGLGGFPINGSTERKITEGYGVTIDEVLDGLAAKVEEINIIKNSVKQIKEDSVIYLPPDSKDPQITNGLEEYRPAEIVPKVETILFFLQENYELEIKNKDINILAGKVTQQMMRTEPYVVIDIPKLNRIILACNEKGNITYVFDQDKIKQTEIQLSELVGYTKKQLDNLIDDFENIGIRITHTSKFLPKIEKALESIEAFSKNGEQKIDNNPSVKEISLLKPAEVAPEGVLSARGIADELGVDRRTIRNIAENIGEELGAVNSYRFGTTTAKGYRPEQIERIRQQVGPVAPPAPEGVLSANGVADELGVDRRTIRNIVENMGEELGAINSYKFGSRTAQGYSPEQIERIRQQVGTVAPPAPEDFLSARGVAGELGVDGRTIRNIVENMGEELGAVNSYKFGTTTAKGYSPEQIEMIRQKVGPVAPPAPEGVLSANGVADELGVDGQTIRNIVENMGEELGGVNSYRFGSRTAQGYSPEQIEMIRQKVGPVAPPAPEGVLSANGVADELGVDGQTIRNIAENIGEELGAVNSYRFGTTTAKGYRPEQIERIRQQVGPVAPPAPEDFLSARGVAGELGVDRRTIRNIVENMGEELGAVNSYKFGPSTTKGYSPEQIEMIRQQLKSKNK